MKYFAYSRYTKEDENNEKIEKELFGAELIPESPTNLSFMEKFLELQIKMLITNQENVQNHNYASDPSEWPFLTRGIAYYISKKSNVRRDFIFTKIFVKLISRNFSLDLICTKFFTKNLYLTYNIFLFFPGSSTSPWKCCDLVHLFIGGPIL